MCRGLMQLELEAVNHAGGLRNKCSAYGLLFLLPWAETSHNTESGDAFTPPDPAYCVVTGHLDIDFSRPEPQKAREFSLHGSLIALQSRPLSDNRDIHRDNSQPANPSIHHDTLQQHCAVDSDKPRVR